MEVNVETSHLVSDFGCNVRKLAIELDGEDHFVTIAGNLTKPAADIFDGPTRFKQSVLRKLGYRAVSLRLAVMEAQIGGRALQHSKDEYQKLRVKTFVQHEVMRQSGDELV